MSKFALFVDLENCGAKVETLNSILEKVKIRGDILLGKVYGYTDRFSDLKEVLLSNTFSVVPSLRYGIAQRTTLTFCWSLMRWRSPTPTTGSTPSVLFPATATIRLL